MPVCLSYASNKRWSWESVRDIHVELMHVFKAKKQKEHIRPYLNKDNIHLVVIVIWVNNSVCLDTMPSTPAYTCMTFINNTKKCNEKDNQTYRALWSLFRCYERKAMNRQRGQLKKYLVLLSPFSRVLASFPFPSFFHIFCSLLSLHCSWVSASWRQQAVPLPPFGRTMYIS